MLRFCLTLIVFSWIHFYYLNYCSVLLVHKLQLRILFLMSPHWQRNFAICRTKQTLLKIISFFARLLVLWSQLKIHNLQYIKKSNLVAQQEPQKIFILLLCISVLTVLLVDPKSEKCLKLLAFCMHLLKDAVKLIFINIQKNSNEPSILT